jgi:hypothetical protein
MRAKILFGLILAVLAGCWVAHGQQFIGLPFRPLSSGNTNTLNNNLVAYYKLDETPSGAREDSGSNNLDLSQTGTVGANTGIITNAAVFTDDNGKSLSISDNAFFDFTTGSFTIAFWTYPAFTGQAKNMVGKGVSAGNQASYIVRHDGGGNKVRFSVSTNGVSDDGVVSGLALSAANTWYFVVAWRDADADTINCQVDNGSIGSTAFTFPTVFNSTAPFVVGGQVDGFTGGNAWDGRLDEVGVWSRVLTADERTYLYNAGAARTCCPYP